MPATDIAHADFRRRVYDYYHSNRRDMPWREDHSFYRVLVSEFMLQQTQVSRVIPKFTHFMSQFPTLQDLAVASLADALIAWQGLGYNKRAKFLHETAQRVLALPQPLSQRQLEQLPGIGKNTSGAICAYAYNQAVVFIETNIRTVYMHEFFRGQELVHDNEMLPVIADTLDADNPRHWYWALMDYGSYLKSQGKGSIRRSRHYKKQSQFHGSLRQTRGEILRDLLSGPRDLEKLSREYDDRFETALAGLLSDGLIERHGRIVCLTAHKQES